jgi:hypothetical protein
MTTLITNRGIFQIGSSLALLAFSIAACLQSVSTHPVGSAGVLTERIIRGFVVRRDWYFVKVKTGDRQDDYLDIHGS